MALPGESNLSFKVRDQVTLKQMRSIKAQLDYEQRLNQDIELQLASSKQELERLTQNKNEHKNDPAGQNLWRHRRNTTIEPSAGGDTFKATKKTVSFQQHSLIPSGLAKGKTPGIAKKQVAQLH
jgi:hypothetical protein